MTEEKKEKVIHTRVPESLDSELRDRAKGLGISVSNLVRNILSNTVGLVEGIVADSQSIASAAKGEPRTTGVVSPQRNRILGWQECVMNLNAVCDQCNGIIQKGARAAVSVTELPAQKTIICNSCVEELNDG